MSTLEPLIVILGPTSSGKTEMGLRLAKQFDGEIVNADSRQIYREMDIGTGLPIVNYSKNSCHSELNCHSELDSESTINNDLTALMFSKLSISKMGTSGGHKQKILNPPAGGQNDKSILIDNIRHHLFHIINPNQKFSLSQYKKLAIKIINNIHKRDKVPILVGGTGLYISAIVDNLEIPKAAPNKKIRKRLEKHTEKYLFNKLKKIDSKSAGIIGENNKRKLIRALEVYEITGKSFSTQQTKGKPLFNVLQIGIKVDREKLYKKIDSRVDEMIKNGLINETKKLSKKYSFDLPAMSGIGYYEIGQYLENKIDLGDAIQKIKYRTHQYARRQMTWFKRDERIKWVRNYKEAEKMVILVLL